MTPTQKDDLILRHLDGDTSPEEVVEVTRLLKEDPEARSRFLAFVHQAARLRDILDTPMELPDARKPSVELPKPTSPQPGRSWRRVAAIGATAACVAAAILVVVLSGILFPTVPSSSEVIAVVDSVEGTGSLLRADEKLDVTPGIDVLSGDQFTTDSESKITLKYLDSTLLHLDAATQSEVSVNPSTVSKLVTVHSGKVSADVTPQPAGKLMLFKTPMANARVLGTKLSLTVQPERTRLDVTKGRVELVHPSGDTAIVKAGYFGIATPEGITVGPIEPDVQNNNQVDHKSFSLRSQVNEQGEPVLVDHTGKTFMLEALGNAKIDKHSAMSLHGGAYLAEQANADLLAACRKTNELTIEVTIAPEDLKQKGPARIIAFSGQSGKFNFMLGQKGEHLVWGLVTSENHLTEFTLCKLSSKKAHHLIVTYRNDRLVCYLDGKKVKDCKCFRGDFGLWKQQVLLFGNAKDEKLPWHGTLSNVGIYNRFFEEEEVKRRNQPADQP